MRINTITEPLNAELRKIENAKKPDNNAKAKAPTTDKSEFSADAQQLSSTQTAQINTISASVSAQPDVRPEKVAEVKAKIENGYYNSDEFIDKLADKLMNEFGMTPST